MVERIQHQQIRSQRIDVEVTKDGTIKRTLVVSTNLQPMGPLFDELAKAVVEFLKRHNDIDSAEIECQAELS